MQLWVGVCYSSSPWSAPPYECTTNGSLTQAPADGHWSFFWVLVATAKAAVKFSAPLYVNLSTHFH